MNDWQKAVAQSYEDGGLHLDSVTEDSGDGLLDFLLRELSDKSDCDSWEEAIKRLETIRWQVDEVYETVVHKGAEHL